MFEQHNEIDILLRAKKGDLHAFERILFIYEKPIFNYILHLVKHREDAEDLTQKTFLKLYKSIKSVDTEKSFKSWVYKIATNTTYDWFRQKKRDLSYLTEDVNYFETNEEEPAYYNIDSTIELEEALCKIKPIYKTVLLLYYKDGLEYSEIADALDVPINTVKTYMRRAKISLKNELGPEKIN